MEIEIDGWLILLDKLLTFYGYASELNSVYYNSEYIAVDYFIRRPNIVHG